MKAFTNLLNQLYPGAHLLDAYSDISLDSRLAKPGSVFVALVGTQTDGWNFVDSAIANGAVLVITNSPNASEHDGVQVIRDADLGNHLGQLAGAFFEWPAKQLNVIGITGTNGKTSTCLFIARMLTQIGYPCGYVGTNGIGIQGQELPAENTTPDVIELNRYFKWMLDQGAEYCAIEVSSHGLEQQRVQGVSFASTGFTNLSRDHLDYHKTMDAYADAKARLFEQYDSRTSLINADDDLGIRLLRTKANQPGVYSYSLKDGSADMTAMNVKLNPDGIEFDFDTPWGAEHISVPLFGQFNIANLILAAGTLLSLGVEFSEVAAQLKQIKPVAGRMEFIGNEMGLAIAVDYAHTPDSLQKALEAMRAHCPGKLWVVFGCGGDRDRGKRPLMAAIAQEYADAIVVTDDNPRTESVSQIFDDIKTGFSEPDSDRIEYSHDRAQAINYCLKHAKKGDAVLVAGKGHEDYQVLGTEKLPFSDQLVIRQYLEEAE